MSSEQALGATRVRVRLPGVLQPLTARWFALPVSFWERFSFLPLGYVCVLVFGFGDAAAVCSAAASSEHTPFDVLSDVFTSLLLINLSNL